MEIAIYIWQSQIIIADYQSYLAIATNNWEFSIIIQQMPLITGNCKLQLEMTIYK